MATITLTNTSSVALNGKRPGETFTIEVDADGIPVDFFWRRRFEEEAHKKGFLAIAGEASSSTSTPPVASPEAPKMKAR